MSSSAGSRLSVSGDASASNRRSLRSSDPAPAPLVGASKRKQSVPTSSKNLKEEEARSRPKVHAQRKFAQGQSGPSSASSSPVKVPSRVTPGAGGRGSSSSSTASGPTGGNGTALSSGAAGNLRTGERPKTEDFLTFLCLRGTPLCPPELDFFNKASLENLPNDSSEEESSEHNNGDGGGGMAARKTVIRRIESKKDSGKKKAAAQQTGKKLPASVQALKKKYTEQRLAKKVVSKTIPSSRRTRSQTEDGQLSPPAVGARKGKGGSVSTRRGAGNNGVAEKKKGDRAASPTKSRVELSAAARKPSAAALAAKRKTRMATLTAASSRVSRMLTRLTPRGTTNAAFVRSTKKISLAGRSLRGRDISVSSDEEEDEETEEEKRKKKTPPKRRLKSRQSFGGASKKGGDAESESDADEETSSRDSSRKRTDLKKKLHSHSSLVKKREGRSASRDSSDSSHHQHQRRKSRHLHPEDGGASSSKESTPVRKVLRREAELKRLRESSGGHTSESERRKSKKEKSKQSLKELQDMLLLEAKKKISDPEVDGKQVAGDSDTGDSGERITISQKTGYIQVKPRKSTDQSPDDEVTIISAANPAVLGPSGRRLSKGSERTPTPPRKILPKPAEPSSTSSSSSSNTAAPRSHLPVGVIGAAAVSSVAARGVPVKPTSNGGAAQQVPLNQPLVINTGFPASAVPKQQIIAMPLQVTTNPSAGNNCPSGNKSASQQQGEQPSKGGSAAKRPNVAVTQPLQTGSNNSKASKAGNPGSHSTAASGSSNPQQLVSPGPPMLSPQEADKAENAKKLSNNPNTKAAAEGNGAKNPSSESRKKSGNPSHQPKLPDLQAQQQQVLQQQQMQHNMQQQQQMQQRMNPAMYPQVVQGNPSMQQQQQQYSARPPMMQAPQHFVQPYPSAVPMQQYPQQGAYGYPNQQGFYPQQMQPMMGQMQQPFSQIPPGYAPLGGQQHPQQHSQQQPQHAMQQPQQAQQQQQHVKNVAASSMSQGSNSSSAQTPVSKSQAKQEAKQKSIFSKATTSSTLQRSESKSESSSSFRVENEASPYAFEEASEQQPKVPYRKPTASTSNPKASSSKESSKRQQHPQQGSGRKSSTAPIASTSGAATVQCNLENAKEMGSSIPIPKELANQLAAQAKKEGTSGNSEMTYFIPLQSSSGQSFGVAVKLGTEGPDGPNQKVIMKAKLVTQPSGKPVGARVIGAKESTSAKESSSTPGPSGTKAKTSPKSTSASGKKFARMPMASPASPKRAVDSSDSDDSSRPSTSTGRMGSPDSFRSKKSKYQRRDSEQQSSTEQRRDESECCLGNVETMEKFPKLGHHAHLVDAPVYTPTEKEFKDPMKFIQSIRKEAEQFGVCRVVPPSSFKPECNVDDDMRFTAYNQMVHKMMNRWGPNAKEMAAIRKYLETQNVVIKTHPLVGGVEIDLPALYHAVQSFGGLTEVIQRKRWGKIADYLRIPKGTQDRGNKLDDIYCKYLLPYDTLSSVEREELLRLVEEEFEETYKRKLERSRSGEDDEDAEEESEEEDEDMECVVKGKSTSLSQFFRVARNLMAMMFKQSDPEPREVEEEYWRLVLERDAHVQVQQGSIDTGDEGFGFPTTRASSCGRHAWNLKILSNNPRSLLRCMGPVMGVTVPTINVGMVFTGGCWYRDPHGLPWVEYHHTGSPKVWYGVPDSHSIAFYTAMKQLVPTFCRNKKIWLPADTAMVPPNLLVKYGVSVCRAVQHPGEFLVVFPKTFTSYICSGYSVSESVYFAPRDYLDLAEDEFRAIRESCEPMMFPLPRLLLAIAQDEVTTRATLRRVRPFLERMRDNEYVKRTMLSDLGVKGSERIVLRTKKQDQEDEYECEICSENLYVSYMCDVKEDTYYCMQHAIEYLQEKKIAQRKHCKLLYTHSKEEISAVIKAVNRRLNASDESSSEDEDEDGGPTVKRAYNVRRSANAEQAMSSESVLAASVAAAVSASGSGKGKGGAGKRKNSATGSTASSKGGGGGSVESDEDEVTFNVGKSAKIRRKEQEEKFMKKVSKPIASSRKGRDGDDDTPPPSTSGWVKKVAAKKGGSPSSSSEASTSASAGGKRKSSSGAASKQEKEAAAAKKAKEKKEKAAAKKQKQKKEAEKKEAAAAAASSSSSTTAKRRKTKARKAAQDKHGNLTVEILDMLLSASEEESGDSGDSDDGSDESWK